MSDINRWDRRRFLIGMAGSAVLGVIVAKHADATPESADQFLRTVAEGMPKDGKVSIKAPDFAENGNSVPVTVSVDSPMTETEYVKAIHIVAEGNPSPGIASFFLGPANGKAEVQIRVRLSQTQKIIAVVQMSDGTLWRASREVKVALGGCGG